MIQVLYIEGPKGSGKSTYIRSLANKLLISAKYNIIFSHDVFEPESFSYILQGRYDFRKSEIEDINNRIKKNGYDEKIPTPNDWVIINSAADDGQCVTYFYDKLLNFKDKMDWNIDNLLIISAIRPPENRSNSLHNQIRDVIHRCFRVDKELTINLSPIREYLI